MKTEFVTYEQALVLKELGFDEPCIGYYVLKDYQLYYDTIIDRKDNSFRNNTAFNLYNDLKEKIAAPLKQQVFRWFREKYGLCQIVIQNTDKDWTYEIMTIKGTTSYYEILDVLAEYEEAESACINKLIEIVKNK